MVLKSDIWSLFNLGQIAGPATPEDNLINRIKIKNLVPNFAAK